LELRSNEGKIESGICLWLGLTLLAALTLKPTIAILRRRFEKRLPQAGTRLSGCGYFGLNPDVKFGCAAAL
jgi:hypothetical protein